MMRGLRKNFLLLTALLVGIAAGCGLDSSTGPEPQGPDWNQVRYQESTPGEESYLDLAVQPDGRLTMTDTRGDAVSIRGLLAGENLETLARLLDALPPLSYSPESPCQEDGFVVTVTRGTEVLTFASDPCDTGAPAALADLQALFEDLKDQAVAPRTTMVAYQILDEGTDTDIAWEGTRIVENRDDMLRLLREHRKDAPVAVPRVDFGRQFVVAEFLGERSGSGHGVTVEGAELTEGGWLRIRMHRAEPEPGCPGEGVRTRPYVLTAVDRAGSDLLFETETTLVPCGDEG